MLDLRRSGLSGAGGGAVSGAWLSLVSMTSTPGAARLRAIQRAGALALMLLVGLWIIAAGPEQGAAAPRDGSASPSIPSGRLAKNVAVITLKEEISADTEASIKRRLAEAVRGRADAIVIELDTPGGELGAVRGICTAIKECPISNIVAWVRPNAFSGGAIIALACREIIIAEAGTIGDAGIIAFDPLLGLQDLNEHHRAKFLTPLMAEVVDSARRNGYDEKLVQGIVTLGVELWRIESTETPGLMMFIDREEHRMLFEGEPSNASPTLVGPPPLPDGAKSAPPPAPTDELMKRLQRMTGRKRPAPTSPSPANTPAPAPAPDEVKFLPAGQNMSPAFASDVSSVLSTPSKRIVITPEQRGKWKLVECVSDGRALYTFKQKQLFDFGLGVKAPTRTGTINDDDDLKAYFGATYIARLDRSPMEATAAFFNMWAIKALLVVIFLVGLVIELVHPGLIIPGSAAAVALLLLLAPAIIMGLGAWWQIAAIVLGIALLAVELFIMPGLGVFGVLGLLSLFAGLVGTFMIGGSLFPDTPESGDLYYAMATVLLSCATAGGIVYANIRYLGRLPILGQLVLQSPSSDEAGAGLLAALGPAAGAPVDVGAEGVSLTPLRPSGRAQFGDEIVDVVTDSGYVEVGQRVRVIESSGYRVVVEPSTGAAPANQDAPRNPPAPPAPPTGGGGGGASSSGGVMA